MRSEGNTKKNGEQTVDFSFTTMLQHTGRFGQGFLSKEQCDNTEAPNNILLALADFYLFPRLKSALKGQC
jgi:hypothetical protein